MDTALIWSTLVLAAATLGLVAAAVITYRQISRMIFHKTLLQITTKDGHLVEIINIDKIDQEDPEKIKRALEEVRRANREAIAS
jgi:hypothetical protein